MEYNKEKQHQIYLRRKDKQAAWRKVYYQDNKDKLLADSRRWYQENKEKRASYVKRHRLKRRLEALIRYGNGKLACIRCGFTDERALSIDHINNDGAEHRRRMYGDKLPDPRLYMWLRARSYPEGFQTLCMNCQFIKERERQGVTHLTGQEVYDIITD